MIQFLIASLYDYVTPAELALQRYLRWALPPPPWSFNIPMFSVSVSLLSVHFQTHLFHVQSVQLWNPFYIDVRRFMQCLVPDWLCYPGRIAVKVKDL